MRFVEPASRALGAAFVVVTLGTTTTMAETHPHEPVAMQDRTFFRGLAARYAVPPEIRELIAPSMADTSLGLRPTTRGRASMGNLPWASSPAVPRPLSGLAARSIASERKPPVLHTLLGPRQEQMLASLREHPLVPSRALGAKRMTESSRPALSKLPGPKRISTHPTDPLAEPAFDDPRGATADFIMPFAHGRITSLFNQGRRHPAIDLAGALGSPVFATTMRQAVIFAGPRGGYGNAVITRDAYGRTHLYGHLQRISSRVGQMLDQGDKLGHLGSTGHSTGPHVHYEVKTSKGTHINPVTLLFPNRKVATGYAWRDTRPVEVAARVAGRIAAQPRPRYAATP
jgi:murein DD-endopeptidase MepM/ murein hydrolase activator NlpD